MLVLSRKVGEEMVIDGRIRISVLERRGNRVRLGIEAPVNVCVVRGEVVADAGSASSATPPGLERPVSGGNIAALPYST